MKPKTKKIIKITILIIVAIPIFAITAMALNPMGRYILIQGAHQFKIIFGRKPIKKMLKDPTIDEKTRKKLKLVGEIKKFGLQLGLKRTKTYTTVFETGNSPVAWAVSACPKDALRPVMWNFPIVGKVPYLGFFKKKDAKAKFNELKSKGCDVLMRPVSAYSTLGIFPDPLFSGMLYGSEEYLADTIIHEMTHETIYVKGDTPFNESVASFVGSAGGLGFLKYKYGEDSKQVKNSLNFKHDDRIFSEFMADIYDELDAFYKKGISKEEKIEGRKAIFENAKVRFKNEIKPQLKTRYFDYFENLKLNNAYILFNRRYHRSVGIFEKLYILQGRDLKKTIAYLKSLEQDKTMEDKIKAEIKRLKDAVKE